MITGGWWSLKYPPLLIVRTIRRWEREPHKYCIMCTAMDLMITYVAAEPFNNNHIFIKQLNRSVSKIGPSKSKIITVPKEHSNKNTPATHRSTVIDYYGTERRPWKCN